MKTIAWDCDDVLNDLMKDWSMYWRLSRGVILDYSEIVENPPHNVLGVSKEDYLFSLDKFRMTRYHKLLPNLQVLDWFKEKGHLYHHIVLTSVPIHCAEISAKWVLHNFGEWIRSFNFIPSYREQCSNIPIYHKSKNEWLRKNKENVDIFIEDNTKNWRDSVDLGIESYLVKQPWNEGVDIKEILEGIYHGRKNLYCRNNF